MLYKGCQPYRVPPCLKDEYGNSTCAGKPTEKRHRCTKFCYGDQEINYEKDHKYSMTFLNIVIIDVNELLIKAI